MRIRLAPIRQGEGVSRTISGDSKGQRVLWRVFLCYLSSREERWHPRRAFPFEKRQIGSGVAGFCTAYPTALHQSLRQLTLTPPFTQRRLWCGGTSQVQRKTERAMQNPSVSTADISPFRGDKTVRTNGKRKASPVRGGGKISDFAGGVLAIFGGTVGGAPHQRPLCVKGAARRAGGLFPSGWSSMRLPTMSRSIFGYGAVGFCVD